MARKKSKTAKRPTPEPDSVFMLKLVLFVIIGSQWLRVESLPDWSIPLPIGLVIGILFAMHDHFAIDRKIEYALLLVVSFISFWLPMGIIIAL